MLQEISPTGHIVLRRLRRLSVGIAGSTSEVGADSWHHRHGIESSSDPEGGVLLTFPAWPPSIDRILHPRDRAQPKSVAPYQSRVPPTLSHPFPRRVTSCTLRPASPRLRAADTMMGARTPCDSARAAVCGPHERVRYLMERRSVLVVATTVVAVVAGVLALTSTTIGRVQYQVWAIDQSDSPARPTAARCTSGTATSSRTARRERPQARPGEAVAASSTRCGGFVRRSGSGSISATRSLRSAWHRPARSRFART